MPPTRDPEITLCFRMPKDDATVFHIYLREYVRISAALDNMQLIPKVRAHLEAKRDIEARKIAQIIGTATTR